MNIILTIFGFIGCGVSGYLVAKSLSEKCLVTFLNGVWLFILAELLLVLIN